VPCQIPFFMRPVLTAVLARVERSYEIIFRVISRRQDSRLTGQRAPPRNSLLTFAP
jgi:hypothetical protein